MSGSSVIDPSSVATYVNGSSVSDTAAVSARDRGFTLGDGVFETMRASRGVVFRFDRHMARLEEGLKRMRIPGPPLLRRWVLDALRERGPAGASVRVTVTRGIGPGGIAPPADVKPTVAVTTGPMPQFPADTYVRGVSAIIAAGRRNTRSMSMGLKTTAYVDSILAWLEAQHAGADEAIFLDEDDHCSEATASNLFVVRGGMLITPPLSCAALPGITRGTVLEIAAAHGMRAVEEPFDAAALAGADEAFLTSSLRGIAPLTRLQGQPLGSGGPGRITQQLLAAYRALVDQECTPA